MDTINIALDRLESSRFRSGFKLDMRDVLYIQKTGISRIESHAGDFIEKKLAAALPPKDGRQTPYRGHPVFKAQHATATCCRGCMSKWHGIPKGRPLSGEEKEFVLKLIMGWIRAQCRV